MRERGDEGSGIRLAYAVRFFETLNAKRLDPHYFQERFVALEKAFDLSPFKVVSLHSIVKHIDYGLMPAEDYAEDKNTGEPIIRVTNIMASGELNMQDVKYIPTETAIKSAKRVKTDDILMVQCGSTTGKVALVPKELDGSLYASFCFGIRAKEGVSQKYLYYMLASRLVQEQIKRTWNIVSVRPNTSKPEVKALNIILPPLATQDEMANIMENAKESRRRKLEQADKMLLEVKDCILETLNICMPAPMNLTVYATHVNKLSTERLDPYFYNPDFQNLIAEIITKPHQQLGNIVGFSNTHTDPVTIKRDNGTFRYIEISGVNRHTGEITDNNILADKAPSRARMLIRKGNIIVSLTRPHHGSIALIDASHDKCIASTGFAVINEYKHKDILPKYLVAILRSQLCLRQMLQRSSGGNYPAITVTELKKIIVPTPDVNVQQQIVDEIEERRRSARRLRNESIREWETAMANFEAQLLGQEIDQ